jgi:hypothetical protein
MGCLPKIFILFIYLFSLSHFDWPINEIKPKKNILQFTIIFYKIYGASKILDFIFSQTYFLLQKAIGQQMTSSLKDELANPS